tara:strand:+ start:2786 stop:3532 length:747 start_codon:yes stop_codon:yes gene_type:complete
MKIEREEIDGEQVIITPCNQCLFFNPGIEPTCELGRIKKYDALGKVIRSGMNTVKIKTFCNYARPVFWCGPDETIAQCVDRAEEDNKIKYDLILRIDTPEDVHIAKQFMERPTPPQRIIFSFYHTDIGEVVENASGLEVDFELIQIKDTDARVNSELGRVSAAWSETVDLSKKYSVDLMTDFENRINKNLEQIVAVIGDQYIIMSMLIATFDTIGLHFSFDNIEEVANMQDTTDNIRRFDGERICDYS